MPSLYCMYILPWRLKIHVSKFPNILLMTHGKNPDCVHPSAAAVESPSLMESGLEDACHPHYLSSPFLLLTITFEDEICVPRSSECPYWMAQSFFPSTRLCSWARQTCPVSCAVKNHDCAKPTLEGIAPLAPEI